MASLPATLLMEAYNGSFLLEDEIDAEYLNATGKKEGRKRFIMDIGSYRMLHEEMRR